LNNNNVYEDVKTEISNIINIIIEQNYFQFNNKYYKQKEGLAMGAPTSAILSEIYLQYIEHSHIHHTLQKHNITSYHRYVDDILITYDSTKTNINSTLEEFNNINKTLKFTMEEEQGNKINFLDITIHREATEISYNIYRKPSTTSKTIHNTSCHPIEHKMAAFNYLFNRINCYPLTHNDKRKEMNIIKQIIYENGYNEKVLELKRSKLNKIQEGKEEEEKEQTK
jgi:hypothetical protein